jgi:hypothetical protein
MQNLQFSRSHLHDDPHGKVRYQLKTPYRDVTTGDLRSHAIFEPLDFIARLAALVPEPRVNLTRFHCVFVRGGPTRGGPTRGGPPPNSQHRVTITPSLLNKEKKSIADRAEKNTGTITPIDGKPLGKRRKDLNGLSDK